MKKLSKEPLVSIVITCHNYGRFLKEAIDSCLHQSYQNIEIIVIDDGSTDNTSEVSKTYKNKIRYFYQNNRGVAEARNNGVNKTKGHYVVFLDADDLLKPNYIKDCCEVINSNNVGYVFTQVHHFGAETFDTHYPDFDINILVNSGPYINVSALHKKENFKLAKFNPGITTGYEDWDFYLSLYEEGIVGKLLNKPLLEYRREENRLHISSKTETLLGMYRAKINVMKLHPKLFSNYYMIKFKAKYWPVAIIKKSKLILRGLIRK
jgi:glycosyltransferase involved in cell wall biosynthesis